MKIVVLNGSPKGEKSLTLQYINYIQKRFPQHQFIVLNVAQEITKLESNDNFFRENMNQVETADGVLWAFPLYVTLVTAQYKRFIELIFEKGVTDSFKNKYTSVISTSIHFLDHTAHNYMNAICDDLKMKYVGFFSAEMDDLLQENQQNKLFNFAADFFTAIENHYSMPINYASITNEQWNYIPGKLKQLIDPGAKKLVIITEALPEQKNLRMMIERIKNSFSTEITVINLNDLEIKGGCLECYRCGYNYQCIYTGKDEFIDTYNTKLKSADILIFAGAIKDRYLSAKWKLFFDRGFFNSHTPSFSGKQIAFLISGPLRQIPNLRQIFESYTQWQQANLAGIVTDEYEDSAWLDSILDNLTQQLISYAHQKYVQPMTFLGVGGIKIFRDEIWGKLRFIWQADHRYYKKNGIYDFPQKKYKIRITNTVMMLLMKIPRFRSEFYKIAPSQIIEPFQKIINRL